jgi:hypothetical protein
MEVRYQLRYSPLMHADSGNGLRRRSLATPTIPAVATTDGALNRQFAPVASGSLSQLPTEL